MRFYYVNDLIRLEEDDNSNNMVLLPSEFDELVLFVKTQKEQVEKVK